MKNIPMFVMALLIGFAGSLQASVASRALAAARTATARYTNKAIVPAAVAHMAPLAHYKPAPYSSHRTQATYGAGASQSRSHQFTHNKSQWMAAGATMAVAALSAGVAHAQEDDRVEFSIENIDNFAEKKDDFIAFAHQNIATTDSDIAKKIAHLITRYPDCAHGLARAAEQHGQKVKEVIQNALAEHDVTFVKNVTDSAFTATALASTAWDKTKDAATKIAYRAVTPVNTLVQLAEGELEIDTEKFDDAMTKEIADGFRGLVTLDLSKNILAKELPKKLAIGMGAHIAFHAIAEQTGSEALASHAMKAGVPCILNGLQGEKDWRTYKDSIMSAYAGDFAGDVIDEIVPYSLPRWFVKNSSLTSQLVARELAKPSPIGIALVSNKAASYVDQDDVLATTAVSAAVPVAMNAVTGNNTLRAHASGVVVGTGTHLAGRLIDKIPDPKYDPTLYFNPCYYAVRGTKLALKHVVMPLAFSSLSSEIFGDDKHSNNKGLGMSFDLSVGDENAPRRVQRKARRAIPVNSTTQFNVPKLP